MKKTTAFILALILIAAFAACGENSAQPTQGYNPIHTKREPATPNPTSVTVGNYEISAQYLPFEEAAISHETESPDMDVLRNRIYISNGGSQIQTYIYDGQNVTCDETISVKNTGGSICLDGSGRIYLSEENLTVKIYNPDTNQTDEAEVTGNIAVSKNENFALSYKQSDRIITAIKDGVPQDWTIYGVANLGPFDSVGLIEICDNSVLIGGKDNDNFIIGEFDYKGNEAMLSKGCLEGVMPDALVKTPKGYISASVSDLTLVSTEGEILGNIDASELFGIKDETVWIHEMSSMPGGEVLVLAEISKNGVSGDETVLFKISGF